MHACAFMHTYIQTDMYVYKHASTDPFICHHQSHHQKTATTDKNITYGQALDTVWFCLVHADESDRLTGKLEDGHPMNRSTPPAPICTERRTVKKAEQQKDSQRQTARALTRTQTQTQTDRQTQTQTQTHAPSSLTTPNPPPPPPTHTHTRRSVSKS